MTVQPSTAKEDGMTSELRDVTPKEGIGRRRFLARVGVGGLAVAAATFGRATPASAAACGCCNLAHCPPTVNYNTCITTNWYSWRCSYSLGSLPYQCQCCETKSNAKSAYACWPR
jgi:hypothetical protein